MKLLRLLPFVLIFLLNSVATSSLQAQDVPHYTLFTYTPLSTNPAYTGAFEGTVRVGGHFRDQAFTFSPNVYVTPAFYADAPIFRGFGKQDWIGVGVTFFNDKAGSLELNHGGFLGSIAYHLAMDKKRTSVLTFAVQGGSMSRNMKTNNASFADQLMDNMLSSSQDINRIGGMEPNQSYFDLNAGILLRSKFNKQTDMNLGVAVKHILTPKYGFIRANDRPTTAQNADSLTLENPLRITFHGDFKFTLNKKWALSPAFLANFAKSSEAAVQVWLDHTIDPKKKKDNVLRFGLGYRLQDAAQILFGYQTANLRFGFGYDLTLSDLKTGTRTYGGGIEFGASYIFKIFKDPEIKPVIICPRF